MEAELKDLENPQPSQVKNEKACLGEKTKDLTKQSFGVLVWIEGSQRHVGYF
jgi:hypothetical protein